MFEQVYEIFDSEKVYPSEKEKYVLNSVPTIFYVRSALLAYQCKEGFGFLNAVLGFSLDTMKVPIDVVNEYSLSIRGRQTQGVTLFKNQVLSMIEDSKMVQA